MGLLCVYNYLGLSTWDWITSQRAYPWGKLTLHLSAAIDCISSSRGTILWDFPHPCWSIN